VSWLIQECSAKKSPQAEAFNNLEMKIMSLDKPGKAVELHEPSTDDEAGDYIYS
jgi:hypothetical protein